MIPKISSVDPRLFDWVARGLSICDDDGDLNPAIRAELSPTREESAGSVAAAIYAMATTNLVLLVHAFPGMDPDFLQAQSQRLAEEAFLAAKRVLGDQLPATRPIEDARKRSLIQQLLREDGQIHGRPSPARVVRHIAKLGFERSRKTVQRCLERIRRG